MLVITPNTMVYFARVSKAFQYLGPKVGYSANLCDAEYPYHFFCEPQEQADVIYARMEWLEMEGKSAKAKDEMEKADKRMNPYRYEADVLLTGLREWDRRMKVSENYLEWMPEAWEPVDSPAYQWFVRFKYMPIVSQLEDEGTKCWYDHEFAFVENEVRCMFDTAIWNVS